MGFEEATPIQEETIPIALEGKDIIGQAQTGTGKTVAFGIPLLERIDKNSEHIQGIVLTPTRELAIQVAEEINKVAQFKGVRAVPIYGGQEIDRQIRALKKHPQIIVGTPGRLMDHLRRKTIRLNNVKISVLDEADEMLNMGFIEDIETILKEVPEERQNLLFSATMPIAIQRLAEKFMHDPVLIKVKSKEVTVSNIEQFYIEVKEKEKFDVLTRLFDIHAPELAIVFGRTKRRVDELTEALTKRGYFVDGIHGDLTQAKRDHVIKKFKEKTIEILVATDVAARGLDISGVTHIYNFDIPQDPESYVHRIGRTGRAGKSGVAMTLVTPREINHLKVIENTTKRKIIRQHTPTLTEAIEGQQKLTIEKLFQIVNDGNIGNYRGLAEDLLDEYDSITLLAAALKMLTKEPEPISITLSEEAPLRIKKEKPKGNFGDKNRRDRSRTTDRDRDREKGKDRGKAKTGDKYRSGDKNKASDKSRVGEKNKAGEKSKSGDKNKYRDKSKDGDKNQSKGKSERSKAPTKERVAVNNS